MLSASTLIKHDIYPVKLQKLRHAFQKMLHCSAAGSQSAEKEPLEGNTTEPHSTSPPRALQTHQQHMADYIHLFMEQGEELTLSEDWAAPLVTEVFHYAYFMI